MARRELVASVEIASRWQTLTLRFAIVGLLAMCSGVSVQPAFGQPISSARAQWKQSIERPVKDWDYDGKRILGHIDHDICLWDAVTGRLLHRMKDHKERIHKVQFSPDGKHAVSSSWIRPGPMLPFKSKDTRSILWNILTGEREHIFPGQVAGEFSPDGKRIVTFSQRPDEYSSFDAATIWDVMTGREVVSVTLDGTSGLYSDTLHFSRDGTRFVHVNTRGATLFDANNGRQTGRISVNYAIQRYTSSGAFATFDLGMDFGRISQIDIESGRSLRSFEHGVKGPWIGAWTHDGRKVAAFPIDGAIRIWDIESGTTITGARGGKYPQHFAIISPDNSRLAIAWGGGNVENREVNPEFGLYDLNMGAEIAVIAGVTSGDLIGFSPDGKTLLMGGSKFVVYNSQNGEVIRTLNLAR